MTLKGPNVSDLQPWRSEVTPVPGSYGLDRRTSGDLRRLGHQTVVRLANIQAEAIVATEKEHEISRFADRAMAHHTFLAQRRAALSGGDPLLFDELGIYTDMAKLARLEVLCDLAHRLHRR